MPTERRLAAILAADVVGYSRLMGVDEVGTLRALKAMRGEILEPLIAGHRGRIVKTTGDGFLVEFASVVDAVSCAVAIQRDLDPFPARATEKGALTLRIGVNIGDIIIDGADIFGDGVNLASRLESICEPGGVTVSRAVHEQIRDKLALPFVDLGEKVVKNIARPVQVFELGPDAIAGRPTRRRNAGAGGAAQPVFDARDLPPPLAPRTETPDAASPNEPERPEKTMGKRWRLRIILAAIAILVLSRNSQVRYAVDQLIAWATATSKPATIGPQAPATKTGDQTGKTGGQVGKTSDQSGKTPPLAPLPPPIFVPSTPALPEAPDGTEKATTPPIELHPQE
ncbi:Adenylate cyclase, class 3 [Rhizobiales bacterium GAS113]|nr:Adenylate cyclase, class 3 [Rhizobiales bacterium GAS113]